MAIEVWWVGVECRQRQEGEDEIFGIIDLVTPDTAANPALHPPRKFPDNGTWDFGPDGKRIAPAQVKLYDGPPQTMVISVALAENDSGDVEQEKNAIAGALTSVIFAAATAATGGTGAVLAPLYPLVAGALVNFTAHALGVADDIYNPQPLPLARDWLLSANGRRRTLRRGDDPKTIEYTDFVVLRGTDDGGDVGEYAVYFDVRVRDEPGSTPPDPVERELAEQRAAGTPTIRRGARGAAVRRLQRKVNERDTALPRLVVDGDFGGATDARVREFQQQNHVEVDGIVGRITWQLLPVLYNFRSHNFPQSLICHRDHAGFVQPREADDRAFTWTVIPTWHIPGAWSLQAYSSPFCFLRHRNFRLHIEIPQGDSDHSYNEDTAFILEKGLADANGVSFRSHNFPDRFIRHRNGELWLDVLAGADPLFRADATFIQQSDPYVG
ncbi:AbfB domain-containing protein [Amycolatopsis sp. H6(2020)]|nr:AbfB domain-containing protein [Amycolatopsis sp. H6(2020)]